MQRPGKRSLPQANIYTFKLGAPVTCDPTNHETVSAEATAGGQVPPGRVLNDATPVEWRRGGEIADISLSLDQPELPSYIARLPGGLDRDVLQLLLRRGALTIPSKTMIDELLRVFICYVYPLLPALDLGSFLGAIDGTNSDSISLVLFQAVMFAGVTFADLPHLQHEGFQSYNDARKIFFNRVKLLYEMDVESNPTTLIQVLLFMTYWYGQQNDTKGRFYWLRTAFSLATDIGLDRQHQFSNQPDRQRMRRKLWYCCLIRDKLLSITERRQTAHSCGGGNPEIVDPDDFDDAAFTQALNKYYMLGCGIEATSMGRLCAQKVKLCLIIGRILDSQYELSGVRFVDSSDPFMVLIPKMKVLSTEAAARDQELREWSAETASIREAALGQDHRRNGRVLGLHSATLELLYLTALCAVHRPVLLHEQPKGSAAEALKSFSRYSLRSSARRISEITRHLEESHLIQFLPPLAVGAFILASIQHLKDALSAEAELRGTGNLYLRQTLQAFAALRPKYNSADCAIAFIERVRSGKLPYRTFEWEDRANSQTPHDEHTMIRADEEPDTTIIAQIHIDSNPSPFVTQNPNVRLQKDVRYHPSDMSGSSFGNDEDFNIPYFRSSNLEAISDLLLSAPFDANNIDWAQMHWHYVDNIET
ncbi:uncharacterized protein A1O5_09919 [Cladophialophora psammophila CBS 110553]|uniref:Xylanolytic transcriptional activator regulatory domain-containing protein n=1 Tax=Cladophialophora psammophila CBS 110553 TaxID=1182543 RepID=W9X8G1_9EURO|nr:uncharacterized protein A1O5_09919 [Cladophialophora psammophila CBS 110553]EXJ66724.1 hypothetical protein A1O5_09919 [Cladophialophora psammophila CBS 110553]